MIDIDRTLLELTSLPVADRLRVVACLWDSIPAEAPVSPDPEQRKELLRRLASHDQAPEAVLTWDDVLSRLRDRE